MRIGNLEFKEYAAQKPIMVAPTGEFITPSELVKKPSLALGSLFALSEDLQVKLTIERNQLEPDYKLGIFGVGIVSKDEVIEHVQKRTDLGNEIIRAELGYCNELATTLAEGRPSKLPEIPPLKSEPIPQDWNWIPKDWWSKWWHFFRNCVLFLENTTDPVTQNATPYRKNNVHTAFKKRGFCTIELEGVNNDRTHFVSVAKSKRVVYISGIGHGNPTTYTGYNNVPILTKCNYDPAEVQGKILHLLSCQTAKELGPDVIKKGAKAYAGYYENFTFVYDQPGTPINEMELFWVCDSAFDLMMAYGATVETAHNTTIASYNAAISLPGVANTITASWLTWDRNSFRSPVIDAIYGDKTAKIFPYILIPATPFMEAIEAIPQLAAK